MASSIRIIAVPPGVAPAWVRAGWLGVVIPLSESQKDNPNARVLGGRPENLGGYLVDTQSAIDALRPISPEAATWWDQNIDVFTMPQMRFRKESCELIS